MQWLQRCSAHGIVPLTPKRIGGNKKIFWKTQPSPYNLERQASTLLTAATITAPPSSHPTPCYRDSQLPGRVSAPRTAPLYSLTHSLSCSLQEKKLPPSNYKPRNQDRRITALQSTLKKREKLMWQERRKKTVLETRQQEEDSSRKKILKRNKMKAV